MTIELTTTKQFSHIAAIAEEVQNQHAQWYPEVYKPFEYKQIQEALERMLADENCQLWVAQLEGKTIGYLLLMVKNIPESAYYYAYQLVHIDQVAVLKTHQHMGVGTLLLNKAVEVANQHSIKRLELDHLNLNTGAESFFKRKGFNPYRAKLFKLLT